MVSQGVASGVSCTEAQAMVHSVDIVGTISAIDMAISSGIWRSCRGESDQPAQVYQGHRLPTLVLSCSRLCRVKLPWKIPSRSTGSERGRHYRTFEASVEDIGLNGIASDHVADSEAFASGVPSDGHHFADEAGFDEVRGSAAQHECLLLLTEIHRLRTTRR